LKNLKNKKAIFLFGPTASGKTSLAILLANKFNGVVVNADSRQVYTKMPIITAMPTNEEFEAADHRLFNFLNPSKKITVDMYAGLAKAEMEKIWAEGKLPIICGGTGFYLKVLEEGIAPVPALDEKLFDELNQKARLEGSEVLHAELQKIDPEMAGKLKVADTQRIVRALGVYKQTGKTMSAWQKMPKEGGVKADILKIALNPEREWLYDRIHKRYDVMVEMGLMDEINLLLKEGFNEKDHAIQSCGAKELLAYQKGEITETEAKQAILQSTRNYAKRQITWLKGQFKAHHVYESVAHAQNAMGEIENFVNKN
tara:strand:- start:494 stop:1432 length:939 start_codon:yes stop_codon:yes gene_type:complete